MTFANSESGAVTVDWVALTAGLVGLGLASLAVVSIGVQDVSTDVQQQLSDETLIATSFFEVEQWDFALGTGEFTIGSGADSISGTFVSDGGFMNAEGRLLRISDGAIGSGSHAAMFDEPVRSVRMSMVSLHPDNRIGGFQVTLEDGTVIQTNGSMSTGTNGLGWDGNLANGLEGTSYEENGTTWFQAHPGEQAEFTFEFNSSSVAGMSSDNRIVGVEYIQESTLEGYDQLKYHVLLEAEY